jgi:hypothetical protein
VIAIPVPHPLPSIALGSRELLWAERILILFYAFLLLFVPFVRGLQGHLPIELSTRGARWQETAAASEYTLAALNSRVDELDGRVDRIAEAAVRLGSRLALIEEGHS